MKKRFILILLVVLEGFVNCAATGIISDNILIKKVVNYETLKKAEPCPTLAVDATDPTTCGGNGTLSFTFTDVPDGTYEITFDGGSFANVSVTSLTASVSAPAGTYNNLTIFANACFSPAGVNANLSDPPSPASPTVSVTNECGQSVLTAGNYTGSLEWNTSETTESITVTVGGVYTVTQTDLNGCTSAPASANAAPLTVPTLAVTATNPTQCGGQGTLDFTFTNVPDGTYTINYDGGSFSGVSVSSGAASVSAAAGTYNNLIISVSGCASASGINATLSDPSSPTAPAISVSDECGQSVLTAGNYTGSLEWNTSETTESITVTVAGVYTVTQTDINGCTSAPASANAAPLTVPTLAVTATNPTQCGGQGTLDFTFTNVPDGTYTINYDGGSFSGVSVSSGAASVSAAAGTYNNLIISVSGCASASGINATLSDPTPPVPPSISVENNCGESVLTAFNYSGDLLWSTGETSASITVNTAGTYSVTQTFGGCESNPASVNASPKAVPTISVSTTDPTVCQGFGTIDFTFTNVPDGTYFIFYDSGIFTNVTVSGNAASVQAKAGVYSNLTIIVNNCSSPAGVNASLSDPNAPQAPAVSVADNCGVSVLTASGSGSLLWSTGETTASITVNTPGDYSVTQLVDGCTSSAATATAAPKAIPSFGVTAQNPADCIGNGTLEFTFTNVPNGSYSINYGGGSFSGVSVASGSASVSAPAGTYNNLTITVNGCTSPAGVSATLSVPNPPPPPTVTVENNCGESVLTASNYSGSLLWSTGQTSATITVSNPGTYSVTQTVDGCVSNPASVNAAPKDVPDLAFSKTDPTVCQGFGTIDFTFTNVPDGTYFIYYDGGSFSGVNVASGAASVQAKAGSYNNLRIFVGNCSSPAGVNASLSDPNAPQAPTLSVSDNCGESVLTASGSGSLLWSTGETTASITVNTPGDYSVTQLVDGCTSSAATATAAPKAIPSLGVTAQNPADCIGNGTLEFTFTNVPNGSYSINYDGGSFSGVTVSSGSASVSAPAGTYNNLTITVNGCTSPAGVSATLSVPNPPPPPTVTVENNCGESVLTASGSGSLLWSTGQTSATITVSNPGTYSVTQTVDGCVSNPASVNAAPKDVPDLAFSKTDPTVCQGFGTIDFTFTNVPDGTYFIYYDGGSFSGVNVASGAASVQAKAGSYNNLRIFVGNCSSPAGVNASLSDPNAPQAPTVSVANNCGESILTAAGSGSLLWSTGETTASITVDTPGDYSVTQLVDGCTSSAATATAAPKAIPSLGVTAQNPADCIGNGTLEFTFTNVPNGSYTINYDGGSFSGVTVSSGSASVPAAAGTYNNLTITVNGCTSATGVSATISVPNPPPPPTVTVENNCGESVLTALNFSGTLLWSTGENTPSITVGSAGNYSVTQTVDGCVSNPASVNAAPKDVPGLAFSKTDPTVCQGFGTIDFTFTNVPNGTYFIYYDGGSFSGVNVASGAASVQAKAGSYNNLRIFVGNCSSPAGVNSSLSDPNAPQAPTVSVANNCGESVLTAAGSGLLLWSTGETTASITVNTPGDYSVTQLVDGCTSSAATATAAPKAIPSLSVTPVNPSDCLGTGTLEFAFTNVPNGSYTINYDGGSFSGVTVSSGSASVPAAAGTYNNLTITVNGCTSATGVSATISVPNPPPPPTVTVENNCGESVLTASNYSGSLLWSTGENTPSITVGSVGIYSVTQTVNHCISDAAEVTTVPKTIPTLSISTQNPTECQGLGKIQFNFTNVPNGTYFIFYDGGSFTNVAVSAGKATVQTKAGSYNNLRILVGSCSSPTGVNATLTDPNAPPAPEVSVTNECGESVLTATNYSGDLLWSTGETTPVITVDKAGSYSLTQLIDGCTSNAATANASPKLIPSLAVEVSNPEECLGTGTLNFQFSNVPEGNHNIQFDGGVFQNAVVLNNIAVVHAGAGIFNNLRISVNGCSSATGINAQLSDPPTPPSPSVTVDNLCGESVLTASGFTGDLLWSTGETSESITVIAEGIYTVTQTVNACESSPSIVTASPKTVASISVTKEDPAECQGLGTLFFTFSNVPDGNYTIWHDNGSFPNVPVAGGSATVQTTVGTYNNLTIILNGCTSPEGVDIAISDPNAPAPPSINLTNDCGESILTASDFSGTLLWNTGETSESIAVTQADEYFVTQTVNGCTSDAAFVQASPKIIPSLLVNVSDPEQCFESGELQFQFSGVPDGTYSILYDGGSLSDVVVSEGKASRKVLTGNYNNLKISVGGCISAEGVNASVFNPEPPPAPIILVDDQCGESVLTALAYSGSLLWSTGDTTQTITVAAGGNYTLTQTLRKCTSIAAQATARPKPVPTLSVTENNPSECQGPGLLDFTFTNLPDGTYNLNYSGGQFENVPIVDGKASVASKTGTFLNLRVALDGCFSPMGVNAKLSDPNAPEPPAVSLENRCGESVLTAYGYNGSLLWSTGKSSSTIVVTEPGDYTVTQTIDGCTSDAAIMIAAPKPIPQAPGFTVQNNCDMTSVLKAVTFEEGAVLEWSTGENDTIITVTAPGNYWLMQTLDGCQGEKTEKVANPGISPVITVKAENTENCDGMGTLDFTFENTPDGVYDILFDEGIFNNVPVMGNRALVEAKSGTFSNLQIEVEGCRSAEGVNAVLTTPETPFTPDIFVNNQCGTSILSVTNVIEDAQLEWSTSETSISISVTEPGTYTVTQTVKGCTSAPGSAVASPGVVPPAPEIEEVNNCSETMLIVKNKAPGSLLKWRVNNEINTTADSVINIYEPGDYYLALVNGRCTGEEILIQAEVFAVPPPPASRGDKEVCHTIRLEPLVAEADPPGNGFKVVWFDHSSGGNEITSPVLTETGTVTYYAETQSKTGDCISQSRTPVTLTIKPGPSSGGIDTVIIGKPRKNVAVIIFPENSMDYQWSLNDRVISGATGQYYYIPVQDRTPGNKFGVKVKAGNGCSADYYYFYPENSGTAAISGRNPESIVLGRNFILYPNPASQSVSIGINSSDILKTGDFEFTIISASGARVMQMKMEQNPQTIDIGKLEPGTYTIAVSRNNERMETLNLVVTH